MPDCGNCTGCSGCGGCSQTLELAPGEIKVLTVLSQIPFLPIARRADSEEPVCMEFPEIPEGEMSLILQCLEKRGLVSLDYEKPLGGFSYDAYLGLPMRGSFALTQRGQQTVELLELMGCQ